LRSVNKTRWRVLTVALAFSLSAGCAAQGPLRPFTTDGCSDFPDGTSSHKTLWLGCCTEHDKAYWQGGTYDERRKADDELQRCVAKVGEPGIAALMLAGVRVGGSPYWPTRFRWGYGWPWPRGYRAPTAAERDQIQKVLRVGEPGSPH
jgi:hypothetical protein